MNTIDDIVRNVSILGAADQDLVRDFVAFLHWRSEHASQQPAARSGLAWQYSLLEYLSGADVRASRASAGMEVKAAEATVGGQRRAALWQHPPITGESVVEFHVPVPAGLSDLRLRFAIGIRDGARPKDERLVAFRIRVGGWQVWNQAAWPTHWEQVDISLPFQAGDVLRLTFAIDGLGDHHWAWAVWGDPMLAGLEARTLSSNSTP